MTGLPVTRLRLDQFIAGGADAYQRAASKGQPVFLDLKLHDIPKTVERAVCAVLPLKAAFVSVHVSGGREMLHAAVAACKGSGTRIVAVTVLDELDGGLLAAVGQGGDRLKQVERLASLAQDCGVQGIVCRSDDVPFVRRHFGPELRLMVDGPWRLT